MFNGCHFSESKNWHKNDRNLDKTSSGLYVSTAVILLINYRLSYLYTWSWELSINCQYWSLYSVEWYTVIVITVGVVQRTIATKSGHRRKPFYSEMVTTYHWFGGPITGSETVVEWTDWSYKVEQSCRDENEHFEENKNIQGGGIASWFSWYC